MDYTDTSVADKLKLADERLEKLRGTDKYDAFKERVDAMHQKYGSRLGAYARDLQNGGVDAGLAKLAKWDYSNNRLDTSPVKHEYNLRMQSRRTGVLSTGTSMAAASVGTASPALEASRTAMKGVYDAADAIVKGARATAAQTIRQTAGSTAIAAKSAQAGRVFDLTTTARLSSAQGNAYAEAITHFGLTGEEAAQNAKAATDAFKAASTAKTELNTIQNGINIASSNARRAAYSNAVPKINAAVARADDLAKTAVSVGRRAGLIQQGKSFVKGNAATGFAIGGATSGVKGALILADTVKATGGENFGAALKGTFTTARGWKNIGKGFVGALRDVGNSMTFGLVENGDRIRETMEDAKGGSATHAAEKSQDYAAHEESTAPTDEQLQEAVEFLETVMEIGAPQNQWEQQAVKRIHDVLVATLENGQRVNSNEQPEPPRDENGTVVGDVGGGEVNEDEEERLRQVALATPTQGFGHSAEDREAVNNAIQDAGGQPFPEGKTSDLSEKSDSTSASPQGAQRIGESSKTMNGSSLDGRRLGESSRTMNGPSGSVRRIGEPSTTMNGPSGSVRRIGESSTTMNGPSLNGRRLGESSSTTNALVTENRLADSSNDTTRGRPNEVVLTAGNIGAPGHLSSARQAAYAELITRGGRRVPR